jgi:hypothetical protein
LPKLGVFSGKFEHFTVIFIWAHGKERLMKFYSSYAKIKKLMGIELKHCRLRFFTHQKTSQILDKPFQAIYHHHIFISTKRMSSRFIFLE